jgi:hypothetical protein
VVDDAIGQHTSMALKSFTGGTGIAAFESLDDHEEHRR